MSTLAFFPWLRLQRAVRVGGYALVKYRRGEAPFTRNRVRQQTLDSILEPYWESRNVPVPDATLLRSVGRDLTDELSEGEMAEVFEFGALVAFAGLAAREYFDYWYWNRDNLQLIIQAFDDPEGGVYIHTRRRHGGMNNMMSQEYFVVSRPAHVSGDEVALDRRLLTALVSAKSSSAWTRIREAIEIFNTASSESSAVTEWAELVLINAAFERLFESPGKEDVLAPAFASALRPRTSIPPDRLARIAGNARLAARFRMYPSVREAWIRDFFRLRNQYAHGVITSRYPAVWSLREHLLLASFAFPLAVKCTLRAAKLYALSATDRLHINAFEALAGEEHFGASRQRSRWMRVMNDVDRERSLRAFIRGWRRNRPA